LAAELKSSEAGELPQLIFLSSQALIEQAPPHQLVAAYVHRDADGKWIGKILGRIARLLENRDRTVRVGLTRKQGDETGSGNEPVGVSKSFRHSRDQLTDVIERDTPIFLLSGPLGCGKLHLLRHLWAKKEPDASMLCVSAGAFYQEWFSGRKAYRRAGGFEGVEQLGLYLASADGGVLVIQDIEQLPAMLQDELIDRLDSRLVLGTLDDDRYTGVMNRQKPDGPEFASTRVVCTSRESLYSLESRGVLTAKLLDRLRRDAVAMPSLHERGADDVALLAEQLSRLEGGILTTATKKRLADAVYPHNIADLKCVITSAIHRAGERNVRVSDLQLPQAEADPHCLDLDVVEANAQRRAIGEALARTRGNKSAAARLLGRNRSTLRRLCRKLGM
jgi:DNA-binding NtrC family response regulator